MNDRTRKVIALVGLVGLAGACGNEAAAPEGTPAKEEGEAKAPAVEASEIEVGDAPAAAPAEPPPTGHAVAKTGALLFFSSTGDVGFELPPLGASPGMTLNVVGRQDGRLVAETLVSEPAEHYCAATLDGLSDFRLRLYVSEDDLLPVLVEDLEHAFADGTKARLGRGVPVPPGASDLVVRGTSVRVPVPSERLGLVSPPSPPFASEGSDGVLEPLEGHALTYDGRVLDEGALYREGGKVERFGATERSTDALVTVRNPCLELTARVSTARLHAAPEGSPGHFLASPYGAAFAVAGDDEDVWGGLTGTAIGEAYGVGGLGLVGSGGGAVDVVYEVKAGVAIAWADGQPAGQVTSDHTFETEPRNEGGRSCFDAPLTAGQPTTVTLCFAPADVGRHERPSLGGLGLIGSAESGVGGLGLGSGTELGLGGLGSGGSVGSGGSGSVTAGGLGSGSGRKVPTVRPSKAKVVGSLDKDIIRRIVRAHINEVRYCYNQGLARDPGLSGKVSIQFNISASGSVPVAVVADSTVKDANVSNCIAKAVKRWTFPKPTGGGSVVVTYPFVLEPG